MEKIKDYFNEKNILTVFFPGLLASYPLLLCLIKYILHVEISFKEKSSLPEIFGVTLVIFVFIFFYGIGYFIKRIAIRSLESVWDECIIKKYALLIQDIEEQNNIPFNQNWYSYLSKRFGVDKYPIMIGFYNDLLNSYHFELSCIVALFLQCILMWIFDGSYYHLLNSYHKGILSGATILIISWLVYQSKGTAIEMLNLRNKIAHLEDGPIAP